MGWVKYEFLRDNICSGYVQSELIINWMGLKFENFFWER